MVDAGLWKEWLLLGMVAMFDAAQCGTGLPDGHDKFHAKSCLEKCQASRENAKKIGKFVGGKECPYFWAN